MIKEMPAGFPINQQNNLLENFCWSLLGWNCVVWLPLAVADDGKVFSFSYSCSDKWQGGRGMGMAGGYTNQQCLPQAQLVINCSWWRKLSCETPPQNATLSLEKRSWPLFSASADKNKFKSSENYQNGYRAQIFFYDIGNFVRNKDISCSLILALKSLKES